MKKKTFAEMLKQMSEQFPIKKECYELLNCKALEAEWFVSDKSQEARQINDILQRGKMKPHMLDGIDLGSTSLRAEEAEQVKNTVRLMQKAFPEQIGVVISSPEIFMSEFMSPEFENVYGISQQALTDNLQKVYQHKGLFAENELAQYQKSSFSDKMLARQDIKKYNNLIVYGDALVSGVYAVYAAHEIQRLYGEMPGITIVQHHNAGKREDSFATQKMLKSFQAKVINIIDDEDMESLDRGRHLLFVPQHRVIYAQENISKNTDIYTIPEDEVKIYDRDLAVYYIDSSIEVLRQKYQGKVLTADWKRFLRSYDFQAEDGNLGAQKTINLLVNEHLPKLQQLYKF